MSTGILSLDLLLDEVMNSVDSNIEQSIRTIQARYPSLDEKAAKEICLMIAAAGQNSDSESISLVATTPPSFAIKAYSTKIIVEKLISNARSSILMTGYSLSTYFDDLIDTIIKKSQTGIFVKFFINNIEAQCNVEKLTRYKGKFLRIYNYVPGEDAMVALHAKVISVDGLDTLITSANLSYHGQEGNIELGTTIHSKRLAKQVDEVFTQLIFKKIFVEIK